MLNTFSTKYLSIHICIILIVLKYKYQLLGPMPDIYTCRYCNHSFIYVCIVIYYYVCCLLFISQFLLSEQPENLLLSVKGPGAVVKLADFGLAVEAEDKKHYYGNHTQHTMLLWQPLYYRCLTLDMRYIIINFPSLFDRFCRYAWVFIT